MENTDHVFECKTYLSQDRILVTDEFIERNKLSIRPSEEFLGKFEAAKEQLFGFDLDVYVKYLPWDKVKDRYKEEYRDKVDSGEETFTNITDIRECCQDFLDYMNFAWGKAEDERGISASRSIQKLGAWLFIMGREDLHELINEDYLYNPYGAPALIAVCKEMGITVPDSLVEFSKNPC